MVGLLAFIPLLELATGARNFASLYLNMGLILVPCCGIHKFMFPFGVQIYIIMLPCSPLQFKTS